MPTATTSVPLTVGQRDILNAYGRGVDLGEIAYTYRISRGDLWQLLAELCSCNRPYALQLARGAAIPATGAPVVDPPVRYVPTPTGEPLTDREMHVLRAIAEHRSHTDIGTDFGIGRSAVTKTCRRLYGKLGADNLDDALASAVAAGLVTVSAYTDQEIRVLELLATKYRHRRIATTLGLTVRGVESAVSRIYKRLDVHCRADAVAAARRQGLIGGER